jgi:superfamily II DNA or RNA helicase
VSSIPPQPQIGTNEELDKEGKKSLEIEAEAEKNRSKDPSSDTEPENLTIHKGLASRVSLNLHMNEALFEDLGLQFRPNQLGAMERFKVKLQDPNWNLRGYFVQPTGAGKTVLFGSIARMADVPTVIFVPKTNLLEQTRKELIEMCGFKTEDIGVVGDLKREFGRKITIATYQSHVSLTKSSPEYRKDFKQKAMVICDEAHKGIGKQTLAALDLSDEVDENTDDLTSSEENAEYEALAQLDKQATNKIFLGFTATPKLGEKHIQNVYDGTEISRETFADLVRAGILVPLRLHHTEGNIYRNEDMQANKITLDQESKILKREETYEKLLKKLVDVQNQEDKKLKVVAYCSTVKECDRFIEIAKENFGLICKRVTGEDDKKALEEGENGLNDGSINIIVTVDKLTEGWNFPPADAAIVARACGSPARLLQGIGRVVRTYAGKYYAHVFETDWKVVLKKRGEKDQEPSIPKNETSNDNQESSNANNKTGKRFNLLEAFIANGETLEGLQQICLSLNDQPLNYLNITKPPEGWLTNNQLADHLKVTPPTVERITQALINENQNEKEEVLIKDYLDGAGRIAPHYSPELSKKIIELYNSRGQKAPEGWMTARALADELELDFGTVQKIAKEFTESNKDWFKEYLNKINRKNIHFSPELVQIIKERLKPQEKAPADWVARRALRAILNTSERTIEAIAKELATSFPDGAKEYSTAGPGKTATAIFYSPQLVEGIKEKINSRGAKVPPGWMNNLSLSKSIDASRKTIKRIADKHLVDHPDWCKEYLDDKNRPFLYYSPELIAKIIAEIKEKKSE